MIRWVTLTLGLVALAGPVAAQRTTEQMRGLPPPDVRRVLEQDLRAVLDFPSRITRGIRRQIGDITLPGRPVGTGVEGLCQRDSLTLLYASTRSRRVDRSVAVDSEGHEVDEGALPGERYEDVPIRPYGLQADREYFFVRPPTAASLNENPSARLIFSEDCGPAAQSRYLGWFTAETPHDAVYGHLLLQAAASAVQGGRITMSGCDWEGERSIDRCRGALVGAARDPRSLMAVRRCESPPRQRCLTVEAAMISFTIVATDTEEPPAPNHVVSVQMAEIIVVT